AVIAIAAFAIVTFPLLYEQVHTVLAGQAARVWSLAEVRLWSPALLSFVTPSRIHPVYGSLFSFAGEYDTPGVDGMRSETSIAWTIWILTLVTAWHRKRDGSTFWLVAAGVFLVLALGPFLRITGT